MYTFTITHTLFLPSLFLPGYNRVEKKVTVSLSFQARQWIPRYLSGRSRSNPCCSVPFCLDKKRLYTGRLFIIRFSSRSVSVKTPGVFQCSSSSAPLLPRLGEHPRGSARAVSPLSYAPSALLPPLYASLRLLEALRFDFLPCLRSVSTQAGLRLRGKLRED